YGLDPEQMTKLIAALRHPMTIENPVVAPRGPDVAAKMAVLAEHVRTCLTGPATPEAVLADVEAEWKRIDAAYPAGDVLKWGPRLHPQSRSLPPGPARPRPGGGRWWRATPGSASPPRNRPGRSANRDSIRATRSRWPTTYWGIARGQRTISRKTGSPVTPRTC